MRHRNIHYYYYQNDTETPQAGRCVLAPPTDRSAPIPELGDSLAEPAFNRRLGTTLPSLPGTLSPRALNRDD